jgi:hypothetical protein
LLQRSWAPLVSSSRNSGAAINPFFWLSNEQGRTPLSLIALLASAPLLGHPEYDLGMSTCLGWNLLAVSLILPL